eukprot:2906604-Rhodomonas_salina.3
MALRCCSCAPLLCVASRTGRRAPYAFPLRSTEGCTAAIRRGRSGSQNGQKKAEFAVKVGSLAFSGTIPFSGVPSVVLICTSTLPDSRHCRYSIFYRNTDSQQSSLINRTDPPHSAKLGAPNGSVSAVACQHPQQSSSET